MKLPIQAQPVTRKVSTATILHRNIFPSQDYEMVCIDKCLKALEPFGGTLEVYEEAMQNCMTKCKKH